MHVRLAAVPPGRLAESHHGRRHGEARGRAKLQGTRQARPSAGWGQRQAAAYPITAGLKEEATMVFTPSVKMVDMSIHDVSGLWCCWVVSGSL